MVTALIRFVQTFVRAAVVLALVVGLIIAPAGISATHGPDMAVSLGEEHADGHGDAVGLTDAARAAPHDTTDHEHQTAAILPAGGLALPVVVKTAGLTTGGLPCGPCADRLRRPPKRDVI